jgi:hypothetical protein
MLAKEYKQTENWYDRVFVKNLVKRVQDLDPNIGAILYQDTMMIVFMFDGIILYKVVLNELNTEEISIEEHIKRITQPLRMLKLGLIPAKDLDSIKKAVKNININIGKKL